jgi:hypothetical protein
VTETGADSAAVMSEAGYTADDLTTLRAAGAIG